MRGKVIDTNLLVTGKVVTRISETQVEVRWLDTGKIEILDDSE